MTIFLVVAKKAIQWKILSVLRELVQSKNKQLFSQIFPIKSFLICTPQELLNKRTAQYITEEGAKNTQKMTKSLHKSLA